MSALPNLFMMPWYPRDFLAATRGWPLIARAIYRELLDVQWDQGGLLADPKELRTLIGATPAEWRAGWPLVLPKFKEYADGMLRNTRLEEHRQKSLKLYNLHRKGADATNAKLGRRVAERDAERLGERVVSESPQSQSQYLRGLRGGADALGEPLRSVEVKL